MKKIIVVGLGIMLAACSVFQSEQQVQDHNKMYKFMVCAAAHDKLGDVAAREFKVQPSQFTQEDMLNWYALSGAEAQYATHMYFKQNMSTPMDIQKYNSLYEKMVTAQTLPELAEVMGVPDAITAADKQVGVLLGKVGSAGVLEEANYDLVNESIDAPCMEAYSDYTTDMNILMYQEPEASVAARASGACVGTLNAISQIAIDTSPALTKRLAFHSGIMSTFMNAYINDENAEDVYDHVSYKGDAIFQGTMPESDVLKELKSCQDTYKVANQYVIQHVVNAPEVPAQK